MTATSRQSGDIVEQTTSVCSLVSADGIRFMLTSPVANFLGFTGGGVILVAMIGVGLAEESGLNDAIRAVNPGAEISVAGNLFFMIAFSILMGLICTVLTERIIEPRLGPYRGGVPVEASHGLSGNEQQGPRNAGRARGAGTIANVTEAIGLIVKAWGNLAGMIFLLFVIANLISFFNYINLATVLAVNLADLLQDAPIGRAGFIVLFVLVAAIIDIMGRAETRRPRICFAMTLAMTENGT
ncbi:AbgT family transporter [Cereibacter azotoformans]|uniref:AbgT family transporter n=1 Tax=Cereibacter azotoformans TaxID=43057 RepID=UPI000C6DC10B|nr:AbgT family transporter [Cereibacter azotoformans]